MSEKSMRESLNPMVLTFARLLPITLMPSALANMPLTPVYIADVILMVLPPCACERVVGETRHSVGVSRASSRRTSPAALLNNYCRVDIGEYIALHLRTVHGGHHGTVLDADHQRRIAHHDQRL